MTGTYKRHVKTGSGTAGSAKLLGEGLFSPTLARIARKMEPNQAPKPKGVGRGKGKPHIVLTDAQVMEIIRLVRGGLSYSEVADRFNAAYTSVRAWCEGISRGNCLLAVEKEERKAKLNSPG